MKRAVISINSPFSTSYSLHPWKETNATNFGLGPTEIFHPYTAGSCQYNIDPSLPYIEEFIIPHGIDVTFCFNYLFT